jgi:Zn finger protein HypA/HybF involved in hydrogenase expression
MPETTYFKTECQHCKGHIEYPSELGRRSVECPHCKQTTTLPTSTPPLIPPPIPVPPVPGVKQTPPPVRGRLIKCRDCGHAISSKASSCPACGAPIKRANYAAAVAVLGIIAFFVILVVIIVVIIGVNHKSSPSAATPPVKTQVGLTASAVAITNLDDYTWPGVKVWINGAPLGGYKAVYDRQVAPGQRILIPLTDFARGDRRFNPVERKVTQVIVYVEGHGAPTFSFR